MRTLPGVLAARAAEQPHRVAVRHGARTLTFADWAARSASVARALLDRGLRPGQRVALPFAGGEWIDYAVAYCGVLAAGGVAVPVNDRSARAEVRHVLDHSAAVGVVHGRDLVPPEGAFWVLPFEGLDTGPGGALPEPAPGDLAQLLYTSGTTGRPKAVAATHANLTHGFATDPRRRPLGHSEHFLHAFPIGTNAGQNMLLNALDARASALVLGRFTPGRFARLIAEYEVGSVFVVPAMAMELLSARAHERHDLSSVLLLGSTAAALPPAVARELADALPNATIVNYYTSTEAAPAQTTMVFDPDRPTSLGRPATGALRIAGPDGVPLPAGQVGEVWLRSPVPRAYHRDPDATAEVFRAGWVRMGDLGFLDPDGYLHLVDRDSDVVKSGAFKVSTLQVEAALHEHPEVGEAAVFGVEHPVLGTVLAAAIVPRPSTADDDGAGTSVADGAGDTGAGPEPEGITLRALRSFLVDRLAEHELPTRLLLLDALPRNAGGKVLKRELRTLLPEREPRR
ncbi:class I adenylate-forming enzyme family protein [Longispora urticae]